MLHCILKCTDVGWGGTWSHGDLPFYSKCIAVAMFPCSRSQENQFLFQKIVWNAMISFQQPKSAMLRFHFPFEDAYLANIGEGNFKGFRRFDQLLTSSQQ